MKFLVISDIHGDYSILDKMDNQFKEADAVLFGGDFAETGHEEEGFKVLEKMCSKHETIFSVLGNCDKPTFIEQLDKQDINIQKSMVFHDGLIFAGCGGGEYFTRKSPNEHTEEELLCDLQMIKEENQKDWNNLILIIHNPPKDTKCDTISNGMHVGGKLIREFIEEIQPLVVITGHIHESKGIDTIGKTTIINPGALLEGNYAWLTVNKKDDVWSIDSIELKTI